mmetsp:Transcript_31569/g.65948  ORF Transcript_31569/g.65948 Transcript_31569/m.65948 type:complete len:214 (+) Transcript_31569:979-1620(+)
MHKLSNMDSLIIKSSLSFLPMILLKENDSIIKDSMMFQFLHNPSHGIIEPDETQLLVVPGTCPTQHVLTIGTAISRNQLRVLATRNVGRVDISCDTFSAITILKSPTDIARPVRDSRIQIKEKVLISIDRSLDKLDCFSSHMFHVVINLISIRRCPFSFHIMRVHGFGFVETTVANGVLQLRIIKGVPKAQMPLSHHTSAVASTLKVLSNIVA